MNSAIKSRPAAGRIATAYKIYSTPDILQHEIFPHIKSACKRSKMAAHEMESCIRGYHVTMLLYLLTGALIG